MGGLKVDRNNRMYHLRTDLLKSGGKKLKIAESAKNAKRNKSAYVIELK